MSDLKKIANTLHSLERKVLPLLEENKDLKALMNSSCLQEVEVTRALQWMENKGIVKVDSSEKNFVKLDKNGINYVKNSLPESQFVKSLGKKSLNLEDIKKESGLSDDEVKVCIGLLKRKNLLETVSENR